MAGFLRCGCEAAKEALAAGAVVIVTADELVLLPTGVGQRSRRRACGSLAMRTGGAVLQEVGRQLGQFRAFAALQFDVCGDRLFAEPADEVVEAVGG